MVIALAPVEREIGNLATQVANVRVVDQGSFDFASDLLNQVVKRLRRQVAEHHDPLIQSAHANWKLNLAAKKRLDDPLNEAEATLKGQIGAWLQAQERERREAQRLAEAEALRQAQEAALARAVELEAQGADPVVVEAELAKPVVVEHVAVIAPTFTPRADIGTAKTYSAEVVDLTALVKAAAADPRLTGFLLPNQTALNAMARAQKETLNIPGVRLVTTTGVRGIRT